MRQALKVGDPAPDLTLEDASGKPFALAEAWRKGPAVVFFYPKDETPGCTEQACTFRDRFDEFVESGAQVIGISSDSVASHEKFRAKHSLNFPLLSDPQQLARAAFGVPKSLAVLPGRVTYVIDASGIIRHVFNSFFGAKQHIDEALLALSRLAP